MSAKTNTASSDAQPAAIPKDLRGDILLIGLTSREVESYPPRLFGALSGGAEEAGLDALEPERLKGVMAILSPVVSKAFDAIDVAERLNAAGFGGHYIAYVEDPMDESVIRAEVQEAAPGVAFDIVTMGHGPRLAAG